MIREPILAHSVNAHPLYVKTPDSVSIGSLLVAPLFDEAEKVLFGTISLSSSREGTFTIEDEITLASLSYQASLALSRARHFKAWKKQGGTMKSIFNSIRAMNLNTSEENLCNEIALAAKKTLGFGMARIRLLDPLSNNFHTIAISGLPESVSKQMLNDDLPFSVLEPFFTDEYRAETSFLIPHDNAKWHEVADEYFYIPKETQHIDSGWRAYDALLTPLVDQSGQTLGLLSLDLPDEGVVPNPNVLEEVGVFSSAAAWALELSRTQQRLKEQQRRTWTFLGSLGPELARRAQDFQSIGEMIVQFGAQILNVEGCSLYMICNGNEGEPEIELTHSTYLANTSYIGRRKPVRVQKGCGLTAWVAATKEPICTNDYEHKGSHCMGA